MKDISIKEYRIQNSGNYLKRLKSEPVYGPINSRRLGLSLGINPIQGGFGCNYNCSYCQYGIDDLELQIKKTKRVRFTEIPEIEYALQKRLQSKEHYDSITICGPTEPLLHPNFDSIVNLTVRLRDVYRPEIPTSLFTNASRIRDRNTLPLDYVFMKLDAGNKEIFQRVNRPRGITFREQVEQIKGASVKIVIIQTMIIGRKDGNYEKENIADYKKLLKEIKPEEVHLYSILYKPPPNMNVEYVDRNDLTKLANEIEKDVNCRAMVFVDPVREGEFFRF
jgi:wyosine [tRNA(Phe)-imidazoG37] synthetase (radical SAM superfamily)